MRAASVSGVPTFGRSPPRRVALEGTTLLAAEMISSNGYRNPLPRVQSCGRRKDPLR
jgi:hypothetical protein